MSTPTTTDPRDPQPGTTYLVLKDGWRWAAPIRATTPERALRTYLREPIEKTPDAIGAYRVFNDDETAVWHFNVHAPRDPWALVIRRDGPKH